MVLRGCRGRHWRKWKTASVKLTAIRYSVRVLGYLKVRCTGGLLEGGVLVADSAPREEVVLLLFVVADGLLLHERLLVLIEDVNLMALPFIRLARHSLLIMAPRVFLYYSLHRLPGDVHFTNEELIAVVLLCNKLVSSDSSVGIAVNEETLAELLGVVILGILVFVAGDRPRT